MAIYHYHREIGTRTNGKNAVFAAAYIRGQKRTCDKTGETKDFSDKTDVVYKNVFLPEDSPLWANALKSQVALDSEGKKHIDADGTLFSTYAWNQIEFIEKRVDSQLYFHDDIAIPNALNLEQAIELVEDFVQSTLAINGVFCDVAIHWDEGNHHVHVLMPLRTLTEEGFSKKLRFKKSDLTQEVKRVRSDWACFANRKLQTLGLDERIDHRSNKDRGIELLPSVKVGKFGHFADHAIAIRKADENAAIRQINSDAIKANPDVLGLKIRQERASFDSLLVGNEINRHVILESMNAIDPPADKIKLVDPILDGLLKSIQKEEGIFNARQLKASVLSEVNSADEFDRIYNQIIAHESIYSLGLGEDGREHFVGKHAFDLEKELLQATHELASRNQFNLSKRLVTQVSKEFGLNGAQTRALLHLTRTNDVAIVCGYAGTGKTYLLKAAKVVWEKSGFQVVGLATSGKAASGLQSETGIASNTIYGFLDSVKKQKITIDNKTIVVMDEMGMTSLDDMHALAAIVLKSGAKFTGVGDIEQTQPVGRGAPQRAMVDAIGTVYLDDIIRQKVAWQKEATTLFETNQTAAGFDLYEANNCVHLHETNSDALIKAVNDWHGQLSSQPDITLKDVTLAAFKNETVEALNLRARHTLVVQGVIQQGQPINLREGMLEIAVGERLLLTKNDSKAGVRNGDFATVRHISDDAKTLTLELDNNKTVVLNVANYGHFKYGYAATVHKLQGHTTNHLVGLIDGEGWDRHKFLVAATRHKVSLSIHAGKETFVDLAHLKSVVSRHGLNDILTDFPVAFAERRGFDVKAAASRSTQLIQKGKLKIFDALGYLFNHQAATELGQSAYDLERAEIMARRKEAVIVAEFCDNRVEVATHLETMQSLDDDDAKRLGLQRAVYALQYRNGELAAIIKAHPLKYALALERNRLSERKIESSFAFYERHHRVLALVGAHQANHTMNPADAFTLIDQIKPHYGAICHALPDKDKRNQFMKDVGFQADRFRRDTALVLFGLEQRPLINAVAQYKALDYEVGSRLLGIKEASDLGKKDLQRLSASRDKLAFELFTNPNAETMIAHFALSLERLQMHAEKYKDKLFVKAFAEMPDSTRDLGNLVKQAAAYRIKAEPKRYGIYIDDCLKGGWKSINIENWLYQKRSEVAHSSREFKDSLAKVKAYKAAASLAYKQWQKAIAKAKTNSPHKNKGYKQAQGLSFKRAVLAHELMGNIHQHVAALSLEKVDTVKLYQQSLQVTYLNRYRNETREPFKNRMAAHINDNLKDYGAGLAVFGLYQEVKERATHFAYLQRIKNAPVQEMKTLIRLALDYQNKKVEAGIVWGQVKSLKQLKIDSRGLALQAKQLLIQRNASAHKLMAECISQTWLTKDITGLNLDVAKLEREAHQYEVHSTIMSYLATSKPHRGELAKALLENKAGYHQLFDNNLSFDTLKKEARLFEQTRLAAPSPTTATALVGEKPRQVQWDPERITQALMNNPIETYTALLGEPKERSANHLRYSGGLIVSTKGSDSGKWYSFTEEVGGTPLQAMQKYLNLSFPEALAQGAALAGLSNYEAQLSSSPKAPLPLAPNSLDKAEERKRSNGITSALSIWEGGIEAGNSIAERYFIEHRGLDSIEGMAIRYWPKGAVWVDFDGEGQRLVRPNKIPAALIAARNEKGQVVSVQRIYLDEKTAGKNTFLKEAKLTKGSNKGAPGVMQTGVAGGVLYIAEGPETAASIASLDRQATVLVSFSVSNLATMAEVIKGYAPKGVFIAADNDGEASAAFKTTAKACETLRNKGIDARLVMPDALPNRLKTDWNDILVAHGKEALGHQFQARLTAAQLPYEKGLPVVGTAVEQFFKTDKSTLSCDDIRFLTEVPFKGQAVPALLVPRRNAQGLLCGETVFALSTDYQTILGEGRSHAAREGFYMAQRGEGEVLILADTLLDAKLLAHRQPKATVVLARTEEHDMLKAWLSAQDLKPNKVIILSKTHDLDTKMRIAASCNSFHAEGASLSLMNADDGQVTSLDPIALEKARLKMNFEKLISQKPAELEDSNQQTPQERFDALKKEYPLLKQYERDCKERKHAQGYFREQMDKKLHALAKEIAKDKKLIGILQRDLPQVAQDIKKRVERSLNRGVRR
ncbi:MAG: AAA family ATPase [Tatlockia sp.]|nr:AAA family ATPase [Tatlockia sp.]